MNRVAATTEALTTRLPAVLVGLASLLGLVMVVESSLLIVERTAIPDPGAFGIGLVSSIPFVLAIGFSGYWLRRSALDPSRYPRIAGWCLTGLVGFLGINLAIIVVMPPVTAAETVAWIRWAVSLGAGVGLLIGVIEGRTIERALAAERSALRSQHLEAQRDVLDYLNSILRHEVLNAATIINGYASNLREEKRLDEDERRWVEIIASESADMTAVIEDVRVLLHATGGQAHLDRVDLTDVVHHEARKLRHAFTDVEVELDTPDAVSVRADDLLPRVFANLLSNAVEHNDAEIPRVAITASTSGETVRIEIADNGPGIPDRKRDRLFERSEARGSTHGLGLYLVDKLVDRYDGRVELTETGPDGTTFTVELPLADATDRRPDTEPAPSSSLAAG